MFISGNAVGEHNILKPTARLTHAPDLLSMSPAPKAAARYNQYTREEVSRHNTKDDCWIILYGKVYNVTSWLDKHPGGAQLLLNHAGEDATVSY